MKLTRERLSEMRAGERFAEVVAGAVSVFAPDWMTDLEKSEMANAVIASAVAFVRTKNLARNAEPIHRRDGDAEGGGVNHNALESQA